MELGTSGHNIAQVGTVCVSSLRAHNLVTKHISEGSSYDCSSFLSRNEEYHSDLIQKEYYISYKLISFHFCDFQ